jgi:hypothetical protein
MSSGGAALALLIAAAIVAAAWYFHGSKSAPTPPGQAQHAACEQRAASILTKAKDFRFKRTAHVNYIDAVDVNHKTIGLVLLTEETYRAGKVTLRGTDYARLPDSNGDYLQDYPLDRARDRQFHSFKELLLGMCAIDPVNRLVMAEEPARLRTQILQQFGSR